MESLDKLREKVEWVLRAQITGYLTETLEDKLIQSADLNRFLVIRTGWHQGTDHYALIQDVEIRKDKMVVIYANNTDDDLAADLMEAGIAQSKIVYASSQGHGTTTRHEASVAQQQQTAA